MIFAWNWSKQCFKKSVYHWFNKVSLEKYQFVTKKWTSSSPGNKTFQSLSASSNILIKKDTITVLKPSGSYSGHTFKPKYTANAEYLTFWVA